MGWAQIGEIALGLIGFYCVTKIAVRVVDIIISVQFDAAIDEEFPPSWPAKPVSQWRDEGVL